ncbi:hypothetical protein IJ103_00945 [Candidatus Saccharibacteria bacterium]|nr:hypothetical protein [Candidatus Saccharibacteria bacterium]MBQ9016799.1 hypothetical protein [Candidatus Saccharibacteria bacterium]
MEMMLEWFPITIYDWEEMLLGMNVDFYRRSLPGFLEEHFGLDLEMSKLIHGTFLSALYEGKNIQMDLEYPIMIAGRKLLKKSNNQLSMSKTQFVTSPVEKLVFSKNGPVILTSSGSNYLLLGVNIAYAMYPYLKGQPERPDLINQIFTLI